MNVLCERCGRSYSLPEGRVTEAGVVVRCTGCGHAFRVRTRAVVTTESIAEQESTAAEPLEPRNWLIRQQSGNVIAFQELRTLRRWIEEGRVTREDEISRAGEVWRRLGAIPELQGLFEPFDFERPQIPFRLTDPIEGSVAPPSTRPIEVSVGQGSEAPIAPETATAEERRRTQPFEPSFAVDEEPPPHARRPVRGDAPIIALGSGPDSFDEPSLTPEPGPASGGSTPPDLDGPAWTMQSTASGSKQRRADGRPLADTAPLSTEWSDGPSHALSVAEEPEDDLLARRWRRRRRGRIALVLVLLVLAATAAYLYFFQRPFLRRILGMEPETPAAPALSQDGRAALAALRRDDLANAARLFRKALEKQPREPRLLTGLAETHARWSDYLAQLGDGPAARAHAQKAQKELTTALAAGTPAVRTRIVEADVLRALGHRAEARTLLARIGGKEPASPRLALARGALAALDPDTWDDARRQLADAAKRAPALLPAHLWLAWLAREQRSYGEARVQLRSVLAQAPRHPFAARLLQMLPAAPAARADGGRQASPATPPTGKAAADGGARAGGRSTADAGTKKAAAKTGADGGAVPKPPPAKKRPPSVRALLRQADRMRDRRPRKALTVYKALLKRKKGWGPAYRGMGWAYLELNEFTLASRAFRQAIRAGTKGDCFIGLGTAYRRLNQRKKARAQFKRYLELYPNGDDVPVAKTNLESLSK